MPTPEPSPRIPPIRWWPAALVVFLAAAALAWIWLLPDVMRQTRVLTSIATLVVSFIALLGWAVFFSGFPRRLRWALLAGVVIAAGLFAALFRVRGVTGDFVPELAFRWTPEPARPLEPASGSTEVISESQRASSARDGSSPGADFPQFLGPERRAVVRGVQLARDWEKAPPRLLWRRPVGLGWSSFAVVDGRAYTQEQREELELVTCYDLETGEPLWHHGFETRYSSVIAGDGPRATPTVDGDRVYTLGATGILASFDRRSGEPRWSRNIVLENDATPPEWGKSSSPLVAGDLVIVSAGGAGGRSLVAYDKRSGEPVWHGGSDRSGYSSPVEATLAGRRQILILNHGSVAGHDAADGTLLWDYPWPDDRPNVAQPVAVGDDRVFVSSGYGDGCALLEIEPSGDGTFRAAPLWRNRNLKAKFTNVVLDDGFIYGLDDGILVCLDLADGSRRWKEGRYGHGQMLLVEDLLLVTAETGDVALIEPSPEELRELSRFRALDDRTWATPALAGTRLLVRSRGEAACYELPRR